MNWVENEIKVRFEEVDPWQIVWYGHYLSYFEVARMTLLEKFGLLIDEVAMLGFRTPLVSLKCQFKNSARFNDTLRVRAAVLPSETASLTFLFEIHRLSDQTLIAQGETTHVLQDKQGKMIYKFSGALREKMEAMVAYCNSPG